MYRNQRFGGGGNQFNNGYNGDRFGNWGGGWQGGMEWGGNRKRGPGFDMGGPMYDAPFFNGPPAKMMRMEMGGYGRKFGKNQKRFGGGGNKKNKDAMKMADAIIEKHAAKSDEAGNAGESTKAGGEKRKFKQERPRRNPYYCGFCKTETKDKENHLLHVKSSEHFQAVRKRESNLLEMMTNAYEMSQRDVYNARMMGRRIRFCPGCYLQFTGNGEIHKKMRSHKNMEFNLRVRCNDCDSIQPTRLQHEKHLISLQHIRNQMYRMIQDGKTDYDNLDCPEEFEEGKDIGNHYIVDMKAILCKVCDKIVPTREQNAIAHSKTEEHYNNFKKFAEVEKVERPKRKEEEEERKRLEAEKAAEEAVKKEEEGEEEEEEEEKEGDGEEANEEETGQNEEEADGDENEATEDAPMEEETNEEPEKVEEEEAAPVEEEPPKRGRATRRSTRK